MLPFLNIAPEKKIQRANRHLEKHTDVDSVVHNLCPGMSYFTSLMYNSPILNTKSTGVLKK